MKRFSGLFCAVWLGVVLCAAADFDLNGFIRSEIRAGNRNITLPDGDIYIRNTVILDPGCSQLTIRGGKNTRIVQRRTIPFFSFTGGRDITLANLTFDLDPLPITQGTLTRREGDSWYFKLHDGYPRLEKKFLVSHPQFFDAATRLYRWDGAARPAWVKQVRMISESEGVIDFDGEPKLRAGDFVALNTRFAESIKIRNRSGNLTFEDLTFHATSGYGIIGRRTDGFLHIRRCKMIRAPQPPPGATERRLMSGGADAFNFASCRQGPVIEDCEVEAIGDDSINLHGEPFPILKQEKRFVWFCAAWKPLEYLTLIRPGDTVRRLSPGDYAVEEEAKVVALTVAEPLAVDVGKRYPAGAPAEVQIFRMELDRDWDGVPPGSYLDVPAIQAPGFVIRNNYFHNHRARGIRSQASCGVIENNRIEHLEAPAITIGPEYQYWNEGGWVNDVRIRGNHIREVGLGMNHAGTYTLGAICTFGRIRGTGRTICDNRGVVIEDNVISGSPIAGIALVHARDSAVRRNRIEDVCRSTDSQAGRSYKLPRSTKPILEFMTENIEITGNEVK